MRVTGTWEAERVEGYLRETVVPVRVATHAPSGLWMLSLWYRYRDEALLCATRASADIVDYLETDDRVAFEVSANDPPYMGVRGAGRASIEADPEKELLRELLERYLGGTDDPLAADLLDPDREEVRIRIEPGKLYSWDFSERMSGG